MRTITELPNHPLHFNSRFNHHTKITRKPNFLLLRYIVDFDTKHLILLYDLYVHETRFQLDNGALERADGRQRGRKIGGLWVGPFNLFASASLNGIFSSRRAVIN